MVRFALPEGVKQKCHGQVEQLSICHLRQYLRQNDKGVTALKL